MQIRPSIPLASLLAVMLASPAVKPFSAKLTATTKSVHVAQLPAPTGHRQPTMNDLPPSLREEEKSGTEASPTQDPQAGCRRRAKRSAKWATTNAEGRARQWCSPNLRPVLTAPLSPPADRPPGVARWSRNGGCSGRQAGAVACCSSLLIVDEATDTIRTLTWRQSGSVEAAISAALRAAILLGLGLRNSERTVELSI